MIRFLLFLLICIPVAYACAKNAILYERKSINLIKFDDEKIEAKKAKSIKYTQLKELDYSKGIHSFSHEGAVDLGMANVPVLDQGAYGTCVTFATTAALDALLERGDFISQQCTLELMKGIGNDVWNGAYYPTEILDPLMRYGVVSKAACPRKYPDPDKALSPSEYKFFRDEEASKEVALFQYEFVEEPNLDAVKVALNQGKRVLVAFLISAQYPEAVLGFNAEIDGEVYKGGLWACKQESSKKDYCVIYNAGHEVIIVGYDDDQELLKIRNSWSDYYGEKGEFYMTYTYFKKMSLDHTSIW